MYLTAGINKTLQSANKPFRNVEKFNPLEGKVQQF